MTPDFLVDHCVRLHTGRRTPRSRPPDRGGLRRLRSSPCPA
ncbi:hypothetical protein QJS66_00985 [Kocuria rhizophila]|nr:hypothetical protein QJS66_00985 [Kocuria rhizophila]